MNSHTQIYLLQEDPTDSQLNFFSDTHISCKASVVRSLSRRAYFLCSSRQDTKEELATIHSILRQNGYNDNFIRKYSYRPNTREHPIKLTDPETTHRKSIYLPWSKHLKAVPRILKRYQIRTVFKNRNKLVEILKHKINKKQQLEKCLIYRIPCSICSVAYIGETARTYTNESPSIRET